MSQAEIVVTVIIATCFIVAIGISWAIKDVDKGWDHRDE